ncbi:MAG TPA: NAD(P)/FAD-dependent oxidoreductase [Candidatus Mcinerneyibacteriales bacterium]|nr:NAD(P)/FAD-dependent oxidoreductase [Candidatus Mcinerneyibacteriales bacterium]
MTCFDVIVAGAGPAGSLAARHIAESGFSVALLEKRQEVGTPVRCAEGVSEKWLLKHTGVEESWVEAEVKGAILRAPDGSKAVMHYAEKGFILDRARFDRDLAWKAAQSGAFLLTRAAVTKIDPYEEFFIIRTDHHVHREFKTSLLILADGIESGLAPQLGIRTSLAPSDIEMCLQYTLEGAPHEEGFIEMAGGNEVAPGGYAWIFPKGGTRANVGLGLLGSRSRAGFNARFYLDRFVAQRFPRASVIRTVAGAVSASEPLEEVCGEGFMIVGDAARLANPLTGAGIGNALESGALAGQTAVEALKKGTRSRESLEPYKHRLMRSIGHTTKKFYRIKEPFVKFADEDIINMIRLVSQIDPSRVTVAGILEAAFKENKAVLALIRKAFFS